MLQQPIKRNLSYNDLKKRRMIRSMTNRGKLFLAKDSMKNTQMQNYCFTIGCTLKQDSKINNSNSSFKDYLDKGEDKKKLNILNHTQNFKKMPSQLKILKKNIDQPSDSENRQNPAENQEGGNIKCKNLRILTKKTSLIGHAKINLNILKRIDGNNLKIKQIEKVQNKQMRSKYLSVKEKSLQCTENQKENKKQNSLFNNLSPIKEKNQQGQIKQTQVSGLSLIIDIQQKEEKIKKISAFESSYTTGIDHRLQLDSRMPKIMKKHLPKDFFLRV